MAFFPCWWKDNKNSAEQNSAEPSFCGHTGPVAQFLFTEKNSATWRYFFLTSRLTLSRSHHPFSSHARAISHSHALSHTVFSRNSCSP